ncbi:MAG: phenylalanine--tRNA ligase subunit beta [Dehalococcoidia bacterium]|nr:phenylalanine--tRNA ligase subunit beta [Dehalococcoidia bacterium]MDD5493651.1 phenylalanine--tRNA ligase subunit beta [Dehalococcoidia bacterium]
MKAPLKWLKDYVDIDIPYRELAYKLTLAGLEVSDIKVIGGSWDNVVVGQITAVNPHPNADRLRLATVDLGQKQMTVVCGAPNLAVGDKIAFAAVGAKLLDGHTGQLTELKPAKIRGVASEGMVCSEKELGISDNHEGILVLPPDLEVGKALSDYLADIIFDIDITPNRADCLSIMGIAREVAAITGKEFRLPDLSYKESGKEIGSYAAVEIKAPDLCPRYCASVIDGIKIGPSPKWMQDRLLACGMRPISNIVDVTNYVMLEFGQPLHAFDYREIRGKKIIVRRAAEGEVMYTLDQVERKFSSDHLMIADAERAVAVAGIMGGLSSEVTPGTTVILLESANFNQAVIHKGSLNLKLSSEASTRFEKGLNPELALIALKRATQLMADLGGGSVAKGLIDVYPGKTEKKPVAISSSDTARLLGMDIKNDEIRKYLESLGLKCNPDAATGKILVEIPWWRNDIACTADLVEEVARVVGYDNIPTTTLSSSLPGGEGASMVTFRQEVRDILVACGFQEVITYPLTNLETLNKLSPDLNLTGPQPLAMANPMSRDLEFLRTSLRFGVLTVLARNQRNREENIRLFEMGKVFIPRAKDLPLENEMLCGLIDSVAPDAYWAGKAEMADFYSAKGAVEALLSRMGLQAVFQAGEDVTISPGKCAHIIVDGEKLGVIGEVHPRVRAGFDIQSPAFLFEIDMDKLKALCGGKQLIFKAVTKFPSTERDIALLIDIQVTYEKVAGIISGFPLVVGVRLFDLYAGEQIPAGKKSLAFRITYQAEDHTLTDEEVEAVQQKIVEKLAADFGAGLRS